MGLPPGFLAMLDTTIEWQSNTGTDQWGNEAYTPPTPIKAFVNSQTIAFGSQDQNTQEDVEVFTMEVYTDAVGIGLKDKITVGGVTLFVQAVNTPKDAVGEDLMHTVTATTESRG